MKGEKMKGKNNKLVTIIVGVIIVPCALCFAFFFVDALVREVGILPTYTPRPTETNTPTPEPTNTPLPTDTPEPTNTPAPTNTPEPTNTPTPTLPPTDTPEPTATLPPEEALTAAVRDAIDLGELEEVVISFDNEVITVSFQIGDNLTTGMIIRGAKIDIAAILEVVQKSGLEYGQLDIVGYIDLIDNFGNTQNTAVIKVDYLKATVDRINFDRFLSDDVYAIADDVDIHPALQE